MARRIGWGRGMGGIAGVLLAAIAGLGAWSLAQDGDRSPASPPVKGAVVLFDGRDTSHWVRRGGQPATWKVSDGAMTARGGDIVTTDRFQDFQLHIEFMVPDMPKAKGQEKGNSGVYLQGRYEIQVLDSYGFAAPGKGDCGAVYDQSAPLVNACKPALQWQSFDILFRAPRFDAAGMPTEKARVTVLQNGIVIQNNTEITGLTGGALDEKIAEPGPLLLQDHGNPIQYRNIWALPLPPKGSDRYAPH